MVERSPSNRPTSIGPSIGRYATLADDAFRIETFLEQAYRTKFLIAAEDIADGLGFGLVDDQLPVFHVIAERGIAAHPHSLFLGSGNLVAYPLAGDLPLELGKRQQYVQGQPAHRGGGVEGLRHRYEGAVMGIEHLDDLGKVEQGAGKPIDLVDDNDVDLRTPDVS